MSLSQFSPKHDLAPRPHTEIDVHRPGFAHYCLGAPSVCSFTFPSIACIAILPAKSGRASVLARQVGPSLFAVELMANVVANDFWVMDPRCTSSSGKVTVCFWFISGGCVGVALWTTSTCDHLPPTRHEPKLDEYVWLVALGASRGVSRNAVVGLAGAFAHPCDPLAGLTGIVMFLGD